MGSRAPLVVDAIITAVTAAAGAVKVYDGPYVTGDTTEAIHIGYDADPDGSGEAVASDQAWAGLGARARDETLLVTNGIHVYQGDANVKAARDRAYQLLAIVENAIHTSPAMQLTPPTWAGVSSHRLVLLDDPQVGLEVWLTFQITVRTRL